jgi:predicted nucleic acid-binding protein
MIVVDSNVIAFYLIEGERTPETHALKQLDPEWILPSLWFVELQSILWQYVRFKGMPLSSALELLDSAIRIFSPNEQMPSPDVVLREAVNRSITVYDAQYVVLAMERGVPCVTEDAELLEKVPGIAVSIKGFLAGRGPEKSVREASPVYGRRKRRR